MIVELLDAPLTETLLAEWERLADRVGASPFHYPEWFSAWVEAFGGRLAALTGRDEGELVGILPLRADRGLLRSPANWHTPVFGPVLAAPAVATDLVKALLGQRARRFDLTMLDSEDPLLAALAEESRPPTIRRVVARQPYISLGAGVEAFEAGLPRKLRKELGRLERRLGEQGEVRFEVHDGGERLDELLGEGFAIEGSGWKAERGTAIASRPETLAFYTRVAEWAAERGWLALAFLTVDERPVAFDLCLQHGGVVYVLKGGFDPQLRRFGPGSLLTWHTLRQVCADGMQSYEFLGSDPGYKLTWTEDMRVRWRFQGFARSAAGLLEHGAWRWGRPVAKRVLSR